MRGGELRCVWAACLLPIALVASGCADNALEAPTGREVKWGAHGYLGQVVSAGGAPANEESLKKHMRGLRASVQYDCNIDPNNIEASFVSQRDNEPLVVLYGQGIGSISGDSKQV